MFFSCLVSIRTFVLDFSLTISFTVINICLMFECTASLKRERTIRLNYTETLTALRLTTRGLTSSLRE